MFNDLNDTSIYRINFDFSLSTKLMKRISWNVSLSDRYLSNPAPGNKTNDVLYSTRSQHLRLASKRMWICVRKTPHDEIINSLEFTSEKHLLGRSCHDIANMNIRLNSHF